MLENVRSVKNPLTIIAIFAGIAEISGTIVLPFVSPENQSTYIWFLMLFPFVLIVAFFLTLNFNHRVLYAPSDYRDQKHFLQLVQRATPLEIERKRSEEIREIEFNASTRDGGGTSPELQRDTTLPVSEPIRNIEAGYVRAETLVLSRLEQELGVPLQREMRLGGEGANVIFDAVGIKDGSIRAVEVKYFRGLWVSAIGIRKTISQLNKLVAVLPAEVRNHLSIILAVVTEEAGSEMEMMERLNKIISDANFPIELRIYNLSQLESAGG